MKISRAERRRAVARIRAGESSVAREARRLGVDERSMRRYMVAEPDILPAPPPPAVPPASPPDPAGVPPVPPAVDPKIEAALKDAGVAPAGAPPLPPHAPDVVAQARQEDETLALETCRGIKSAVVYGVGFLYGIPETDAVLARSARLIPPAEMAIRANAAYLADLFRRNVGGPYILAAILFLDLMVSYRALRDRAIELHPPPAPPAPPAAPPGRPPAGGPA